MKAISPIAVIMDSIMIASTPYRFTAAGCGDVISKATGIEDWKLARVDHGDYYGAYAASLALMSSEYVMKNAAKIRRNTTENQGNAKGSDQLRRLNEYRGSSRPCSG